ncbi:MAG: hypothetical protein IJX98_03200 [Clostridia bacterium]|nr:hypothetical protein [Clostridia bacterium]
MATNTQNRKKKLLALFLSLMMISSTAAAFAACNEETDETPDDETTAEETLTETGSPNISNGSFEYGFTASRDKGTKLIVTAPTGWGSVSSGSNPSSSSASGIVDTAEAAWNNMTQTKLPDSAQFPTTEAEAEALWSEMSAYDKLKFMDAWEDADHDEDVEDLSFYDEETDAFNVAFDKLPEAEVNPGTHDSQSTETNVLMIHNTRSDDNGTAQKYTGSTTVTLSSGTSAKLSVWVKTANLTFGGGQNVIGQRGAYIGISHSVGGQTLDQFQVKNIDTAGVTENNGWVNYTFYLKGCSFATSTFNIVLGLGQDSGSDSNRYEYVQGYAFFDDITCDIIDNETFDEQCTKTESNITTYKVPTATLGDTGDDKKFYLDDEKYASDRTFALDLNPTENLSSYTLSGVSVGLTREEKGGTVYVSADDGDDSTVIYSQLNNGNGLATSDEFGKDVTEVTTLSNLITASANNQYLKTALKKSFGLTDDGKTSFPFENEQILMLLNTHGASYTAKVVDDNTFTLAKGERMAISFFVKTSDMNGVTGATVKLIDDKNTTEIASIDTTDITTVDIDGDDGEDIYDGWQQCFFFVENDTDAASLTFSLEFCIGPTTVHGVDKSGYLEGYAAFANFQTATMTETEYSYATSGTYAKTVSLTDVNAKVYSSSVFDTPDYIAETRLEYGIANPKNYLGVVGKSGYVSNDVGADLSQYSNAYAGLIAREYAQNYIDQAAEKGDSYWTKKMDLNTAEDIEALLSNKSDPTTGKATQPLLIYNDKSQSYGFIQKATTTISSDSAYTAISVRVKVSEGATAFIYLTDLSDVQDKESLLSIGRNISYWYDADGNVCDSDPTEKGFDEKENIAFYLQSNGLYTVNENWTGYNASLKDKYFANLQAYDTDADGDLAVADGGVSYDYDEKYDNEGLDKKAFYLQDGEYYADRARTIKVTDFSKVTALKPRYAAIATQDEKQLAVEVGDTKGDWKVITFYLHAGTTEKNFRLEVWSGSRDGVKTSDAGSYVLFDTNNAGTLDATSWTTLTDETIKEIMREEDYATEEAFKENYAKVFYDAYSFFDDAKFLRYNAELDENGVGNSYDEAYDSTTYKETLSYLRQDTAKETSIFVDWAQTENTATADEPDTETDDDTTEDTTTTDGSSMDWGLLISSLVVAGVLVLTLVLVLVRKIVKNVRKGRATTAGTPQKPKKEKTPKKPKKVKKADDHSDENDPYND